MAHYNHSKMTLAERLRSNPNLLLDRNQVEEAFGLSRRWLELAAHRGEGPPMVRISRKMVRYRASDIQEWLDAKRVGSAGSEV